MNGSQTVNEARLRQFSPLDGMKHENLSSLAHKVTITELAAGRILFRGGDTDNRTIWLVSGRLELREGDRPIAMLCGGTPETLNPICPMLPRKFTARAIDAIQYLAIDSDLLDRLITWDQTGIYEVGELAKQFGSDKEYDWMTKLLQTNVFQRIPPANIQAIFMRMQRVPFRAGEVVIQQGTEGDSFYAIVSGKCGVTRETPLNAKGIRLAELGLGDTFGEEALISEGKRNATVRMLTDGVLMRLKKQDFLELMKEPLLQWVDYSKARKIIECGGRWLDVRLPSEYQNLAIDMAMNIPLCFIRVKLTALDRGVPYVVYCDTARRSSAAAFILLEEGFNAYVLRGGMASVEALLRRPT
jgi:CRP-like cAMP-binding protein/rhodanese-related sulfurtransferase